MLVPARLKAMSHRYEGNKDMFTGLGVRAR